MLIAVLSHYYKPFTYESGKISFTMFYLRFIPVDMVTRIYTASKKLLDNYSYTENWKYSQNDLLKNCFAALSISAEEELRSTLR